MHTQFRSFVLILVISSPWLAGCNSSDKDDNPAPTPPLPNPNVLLTERTAFLTKPIWIQTGSTTTDIKNGVSTHYNFFPIAPSCIRDNTMIFHADKTYTNDEGQTRCDSTASQIRNTGTWAFKADGSEITITSKQGSEARWKIVKFTPTEHVLTRTEPVPSLNVIRIDTISYHAL